MVPTASARSYPPRRHAAPASSPPPTGSPHHPRTSSPPAVRPIGPPDHARRGATWTPACPVPLADLRSVTSGLAVDLNPFQNPYRHGDLVTKAFAAIGWTWGGTWRSPTDHMHFSATGDESVHGLDLVTAQAPSMRRAGQPGSVRQPALDHDNAAP